MNKLLFALLAISAVAHAGQEGLFEPQARWDKPAIRVCWFDQTDQLASRDGVYTDRVHLLSSDEKTHYQKLVEKNYSPEKTGVHFTGWLNCSEKNEIALADAVIVANTEGLPNNTIGQSDVGISREDSSTTPEGGYDKSFFSRIDADTLSGTKRVVQLALQKNNNVKIPLKELMQKRQPELLAQEIQTLNDSTFLHELGHLTGLRHEQARSDRKVEEDAAWPVRPEDQYSSAVTFNTPYDHLSIMNYNQTGVLLSIFAAKYLCDQNTAKFTYGVKFSKNDCGKITDLLPNIAALTKYDQATLQMAYLGKTNISDFQLNARSFIDQVIKKIKGSKLAPEPFIVEPNQFGHP